MVILKIIGFIFLIILAVLILAMFFPIFVEAEFKEQFILKIRFLGLFKFKILPQKEKFKANVLEDETEEKIKDATKDQIENKFSKFGSLFKKRGVSGFLEILREIKNLVNEPLIKFIKKIHLKKIYLNLSITGTDAADTGIKYSSACSCVFPFFAIILNHTRCKDYHIRLLPGFNQEKALVNFKMSFYFKLISVIIFACSLIIKYVKNNKLRSVFKNERTSNR